MMAVTLRRFNVLFSSMTVRSMASGPPGGKNGNKADPDPASFRPQKALVLTKVSRYEFEKMRLSESTKSKEISETEFETALRNRGSDYNSIKKHHDIHKETESRLIQSLEARGIKVKCIQRYEYDYHIINWADVIFTAGGDGTFLLAASKITNTHTPVIGINTDPQRSEGHLCISRKYTSDPDKVQCAVNAILDGKFRWMFRRRLRVTVSGEHAKIYAPAMEVHKQQLQYPEYRYIDLLSETSVNAKDHPLSDDSCSSSCSNSVTPSSLGEVGSDLNQLSTRVLPVLALNEVFLGESLSSRVSYLELRFDGTGDYVKSRNSGLCVSTGTGSTSWTYNINKLTAQSVEILLNILSEKNIIDKNVDYKNLIHPVTDEFNDELAFDPELNMMTYTIRDPITLKSSTKPRGKATKIEVKSKCFEACLVIDGSLSYKFNDGTKAVIELFDEDALRTIDMLS